MVITAIGLYLLPVGIKYASGGADFQMNNPAWGDFSRWGLAIVVILVALGFKFFTRGIASSATILLGLFAGYLVGIATDAVNFDGVANAAWFTVSIPLKYGIEFSGVAIFGMCLISIVSAIETVGDISALPGWCRFVRPPTRSLPAAPMPMALVRQSPALWWPAKHLVQPECRSDFNDWRDEPFSGDIVGAIPDCPVA